MNIHEHNAEYTKSVIPQLIAIDNELDQLIEKEISLSPFVSSNFADMPLYNLSQWHESHIIDYGRLISQALPKELRYLIP